jgi:hypothetical protein
MLGFQKIGGIRRGQLHLMLGLLDELAVQCIREIQALPIKDAQNAHGGERDEPGPDDDEFGSDVHTFILWFVYDNTLDRISSEPPADAGGYEASIIIIDII